MFGSAYDAWLEKPYQDAEEKAEIFEEWVAENYPDLDESDEEAVYVVEREFEEVWDSGALFEPDPDYLNDLARDIREGW